MPPSIGCTCASMKPGTTVWRSSVITRVVWPASSRISAAVPTAASRPAVIASASASEPSHGPAIGSRRAPRMTSSGGSIGRTVAAEPNR